ncbi:hypothetical protein [Pseudomonas sp. SDO5271_S396]
MNTTSKSDVSSEGEDATVFFYEQRASTVIFNMVNSCSSTGPFLLPANICPVVPLALLKANRQFELIDISPETYCIDHERVMARWKSSGEVPAGLIYVRSYGAVFDTSEFFSEIKTISPDALIIDDRCLCMPNFDGIVASSADAVVFSTGYAKSVDIGFGGYGVARSGFSYTRKDLRFNEADLSKITHNYKRSLTGRERYIYEDCDWLDARRPPLDWDAYRALVEQECRRSQCQKIRINTVYRTRMHWVNQLSEAFQTWRFNIIVRDPLTILSHLQREGLFASSHYDSLAGVFDTSNAPVAERMKSVVINLFNDRYFDEAKAALLVECLKNFKVMRPECFY